MLGAPFDSLILLGDRFNRANSTLSAVFNSVSEGRVFSLEQRPFARFSLRFWGVSPLRPTMYGFRPSDPPITGNVLSSGLTEELTNCRLYQPILSSGSFFVQECILDEQHKPHTKG